MGGSKLYECFLRGVYSRESRDVKRDVGTIACGNVLVDSTAGQNVAVLILEFVLDVVVGTAQEGHLVLDAERTLCSID